MRQIPLVVGLWLGNAVAFALVIAALYSQLGALFVPTRDGAEWQSIQPQPLRVPETPNIQGLKNPFDPGAVHWQAAERRAEPGGRELQGIMLLPGVRAAVTGSGVVYPGGQVSGGRLAEITRDGMIIRQESQTQEIKLHAVPRPTIQTLNKAQPSASKEKK